MKIDTTLYSGRPQDVQGRTPQELACYDLLDSLSIPYTLVDHEHADTIAHCQEVETYLKAQICKNLFLCNRQKTDFYLLVMAGEKPFHWDLPALLRAPRGHGGAAGRYPRFCYHPGVDE